MSVPPLVTQHVIAAVVCLAGLTAAGGKRAAVDGAQVALDLDAFGPVKIGMSVADAERALGFELTADGVSDPECYAAENRARLPGATFMVLDGRVVRADVYDPGPRTATGVEVGSSEDQVLLAYPDVRVEPHPYTEEGHYLRVGGDGMYSIIFETDGAVVTSFRGGERDAVSFVEWCE